VETSTLSRKLYVYNNHNTYTCIYLISEYSKALKILNLRIELLNVLFITRHWLMFLGWWHACDGYCNRGTCWTEVAYSTKQNTFPWTNFSILSVSMNERYFYCYYVARNYFTVICRELKLLDNIRYLTGISGGCWAVLLYIYASVAEDDETLLGPFTKPENLTKNILSTIRSGRVTFRQEECL